MGNLYWMMTIFLRSPLLDFVPCHQLDIWERGETLGKFMEISLFINIHMWIHGEPLKFSSMIPSMELFSHIEWKILIFGSYGSSLSHSNFLLSCPFSLKASYMLMFLHLTLALLLSLNCFSSRSNWITLGILISLEVFNTLH